MVNNYIRLRRLELGLTQADVASYLGIDRAAVAQWESGKNMPRTSRLVKLSNVLQCSVADIVCSSNLN